METQTQPDKGEQGSALQKIRSELNLEKWTVWQPTNSRKKPEARTIQRETVLPDGSKATSSVEIGFTDKGALNTTDQKVLYALVKNWENKNRPTGLTYFSLQELARLLKMPWNKKVIKYLTRSLLRLRFTPFVWRNAYRDATTGEIKKLLDTFTILLELKISTRQTDGHITTAACIYKYNEHMLANMLKNLTKPVLFDLVLSFKTDLALILYTYLDLIHAENTLHERRSKELFEEFGLTGNEYKYRSGRKRQLDKAIAELQGVQLSNGGTLSVVLKETADEQDYKICSRKNAAKAIAAKPQADRKETGERQQSTGAGLPAPDPKAHDQASLDAEALVNYFYKIFHHPKPAKHESNAINQATTLIAQYGLKIAHYIVDFAHAHAPDTNFHIKKFGGAMQYTAEAIADYDRLEHERQLERERQEHMRKAEEAAERARKHAEELMSALTPDEYQALYDQQKTSLFIKFPYLKGTSKQAQENTIRSAIVNELERRLEQPAGESVQQVSTPTPTLIEEQPSQLAAQANTSALATEIATDQASAEQANAAGLPAPDPEAQAAAQPETFNPIL